MRIIKFLFKTIILGSVIGIITSLLSRVSEPLPTIGIAIFYTIFIWGTQELYHRKTADFILSRYSLPVAVTIQTLATIFIFLLVFFTVTTLLIFILKLNLAYWNYLPTLLISLFITAIITLSSYAIAFYKRLAETEEMLREAEIKNLKLILNPHFFFNILNTFASLIEKEPKKAEELLSKMADLFRYSYSVVDKKFVPIEEELNFAKNYLEIQKIRYGERFSYTVEEGRIGREYPTLSDSDPSRKCFKTQHWGKLQYFPESW
jgi:sensor histidine kinase YesM